MDGKCQDEFEDPHHEESLHKAMEMKSVLRGAGPEALAAMPGVEKVTRVWKSRSDGKRRSVETNVWYHDETGSGCLTVLGGEWIPGRFGLGPSQISPERFGDDVYTDEDGHCWGQIEETIQPDPEKLSKFNAGRDAVDCEVSRLAIPIFVAIAIFVAIIVIAAATGCCRATNPQDAPAAGEETRYADFAGTIPMAWDCREPFAIDGCEPTKGFLVVEKVKDHPSIIGSGVEVGDICLSWGTSNPEVPEPLRDAFLAYLRNFS